MEVSIEACVECWAEKWNFIEFLSLKSAEFAE